MPRSQPRPKVSGMSRVVLMGEADSPLYHVLLTSTQPLLNSENKVAVLTEALGALRVLRPAPNETVQEMGR